MDADLPPDVQWALSALENAEAMLKRAHLCVMVGKVRALASEVRKEARQRLQGSRTEMKKLAPYPFCIHPEKCIPGGRCKSDPVCNN